MPASRSLATFAASLCLVALASCAIEPTDPVTTLLPPASRIRVLQLPPTIGDSALKRVFHAGDKQATITAAALAQDRHNLEQQVDAALRQALAKANSEPLHTAAVNPIEAGAPATIGQPLDAASLAALQKRYPADAYLRVQITDFGQTPKSWSGAYITFEIVTTAAIGALLYFQKTTRPLAGIYLIQESAEELGEGYGGFWLFNRLSRPVRMEADLVDGKTGAVLWHDSETGMAAWRWHNLWHMDTAGRDRLIAISTDSMVNDLITELEGTRRIPGSNPPPVTSPTELVPTSPGLMSPDNAAFQSELPTRQLAIGHRPDQHVDLRALQYLQPQLLYPASCHPILRWRGFALLHR